MECRNERSRIGLGINMLVMFRYHSLIYGTICSWNIHSKHRWLQYLEVNCDLFGYFQDFRQPVDASLVVLELPYQMLSWQHSFVVLFLLEDDDLELILILTYIS